MPSPSDYPLQDSFSFWVWPWFLALLLMGSFFAVNLTLAVISTAFSQAKAAEQRRHASPGLELEKPLVSPGTLMAKATFLLNRQDSAGCGELGEEGQASSSGFNPRGSNVSTPDSSCSVNSTSPVLPPKTRATIAPHDMEVPAPCPPRAVGALPSWASSWYSS